MAKPQRKHYTWDDYVQLPDDGNRYEILEGDLVVTASPATDHQYTSIETTMLLGTWWKQRGGGCLFSAPMDVVLADDTVCQPDLIWISPERESEVVGERVYGIPDLVVEILSPSTARRDRMRKADIYAKHGAREYWLINPADQTVEIRKLERGRFVRHAFGKGDDELESTLDDALRLVPAQLFRRFPRKVAKRSEG